MDIIDIIVYHGWIFHLICGFGLSLVMGLIWRPFIVLGFIAGYLKEVYDFYDYGLFDSEDMVITWIGAFGATLIVLFCYKKIRQHIQYLNRYC